MIVVVAKKPDPGAVKTRMCPPLTAKQAALMAGLFLHSTIVNATESDAGEVAIGFAPDTEEDWFKSRYPDLHLLPQGEGDLGERMNRLFMQAFQAEQSPVLLIGADTPHLPTQHLSNAIAQLRNSADLVLGPSEDGGYYLVGLRRPVPELFENIAWSSSTVFRATVDRAAKFGLKVALLPVERDIDDAKDLEWLQSTHGFHWRF